jgi:hypothetical protein
LEKKELDCNDEFFKENKTTRKRKKSVAIITSVIGDIANIVSKIIANIIIVGNHP